MARDRVNELGLLLNFAELMGMNDRFGLITKITTLKFVKNGIDLTSTSVVTVQAVI